MRRCFPAFALVCLATASTAIAEVKHILFCFTDCFEPIRPEVPEVQYWIDDYIAMASQHSDADGRHPVHSYFELVVGSMGSSYDIHKQVTQLNEVTYRGYGEIECHIHHGAWDERTRPPGAALAEFTKLTDRMADIFPVHGAYVTAEPAPRYTFAFFHGMSALDDSRLNSWDYPDDPRRQYCGIDDELNLLRSLGCYADFTFPAAKPMLPCVQNSIFYGLDDPDPNTLSKIERIQFVQVNAPPGDGLMIIEGPGDRGGSVNIDKTQLPTLARMDEWVRGNVHVVGRPDWIFIRTFTHGTMYNLQTDSDAWNSFFGPPMDSFYTAIEQKYNDGTNYKLHYVSAREAYNIVKAAEAGMTGDPGQYRDFAIKPYANMKLLTTNTYRLVSYAKLLVELEILNQNPPLVAFSARDFTPSATVFERSNAHQPWTESDAVKSAGQHFGELHFEDSTPSRFYRIGSPPSPRGRTGAPPPPGP